MMYGAELSAPLSASQAAISWRGDGKFVATSVSPGSLPDSDTSTEGTELRSTTDVQPSPVATKMQIWERENFQLHADGEAADGLLPVLAWQPNGRHLYAAQQGSTAARVALFERNGLQHGGFDVPVGGEAHTCPVGGEAHTSPVPDPIKCESTLTVIAAGRGAMGRSIWEEAVP